jgi:ATP-dependent DNA ligase
LDINRVGRLNIHRLHFFRREQYITRNGHKITDRFPVIYQLLTHLPVDAFVIDGELVVNHDRGRVFP